MNKIIEIKNISKSFGSNRILENVSLDIFSGEVICIIGRSGIGKSVLVKHINRLIEPDNGIILFHGKEINKLNKKELYSIRKKIGFLFQSGALFDSMNVFENLALPLIKHTNFDNVKISKLVSEKLEMVGMPGVEKLMPSELSGGMRKRVGLARTIILEPEVIIYDEPTTGLDPVMSDTINQLINSLNNRLKVTSIVITHDMKTVETVADSVAMIHDRQIIFYGSKEQFFRNDNENVKNFIRGISS
ncbi:MAG: ABC transporter ATP-binding protein [Candidatus Delongbacteria bacterium]|nr:ABC transporter ATP-binding protein [Candidatus Delongbacteria bacterium]MBN2833353.1 ABC transporter ATP-binding protein [Candidatus Delongbacteria bacterium]